MIIMNKCSKRLIVLSASPLAMRLVNLLHRIALARPKPAQGQPP
jgi:hypothetical protein